MEKNEYLIYGYASVFDTEDSRGDVILKTCFEKSVSLHQSQGYQNISLLWQHNPSDPVGRILSLKINDYGLYIIAKINDRTIKSLDAVNLIYSQIISSFSVGIKIIRYQNLKIGRSIIEAELVEVSIVTFPSNKEAKIQKIQSLKDMKIKYLGKSNLENSILTAEALIEKMDFSSKKINKKSENYI